jgi:hypothetical protein
MDTSTCGRGNPSVYPCDHPCCALGANFPASMNPGVGDEPYSRILDLTKSPCILIELWVLSLNCLDEID